MVQDEVQRVRLQRHGEEVTRKATAAARLAAEAAYAATLARVTETEAKRYAKVLGLPVTDSRAFPASKRTGMALAA